MRREKEQFLAQLRSRGQRVTRERLALFEEIFLQHQHIDAEHLRLALAQRGVKVSRATVYRNLDLLVRTGFVRKTRLGHDRLLFEHVHLGQEHDHLVCTDCGRVVEFVSPGIAALQAEICRAHGFVASRHALEIFGLCNGCAEEGRERPAGLSKVAGAAAAGAVSAGLPGDGREMRPGRVE
jgi:Fur family ferric uptake transcriptional regulator